MNLVALTKKVHVGFHYHDHQDLNSKKKNTIQIQELQSFL
jgi:hypothetical protein